jgi:hypothetical protein
MVSLLFCRSDRQFQIANFKLQIGFQSLAGVGLTGCFFQFAIGNLKSGDLPYVYYACAYAAYRPCIAIIQA